MPQLRIGVQHLRHPPTPDALEHLPHIRSRRTSLPLLQSRKAEIRCVLEQHAANLLPGEAVQGQDTDAARQRFAHMFHHGKLLRPHEPNAPGLIGCIAQNLDVPEEFRRVLHFVDDDGRRVSLEKQRRIRSRQRPCAQVIERNVSPRLPFGEVAQHRGLAHLPRSRDQNGFEKAVHEQELALQRTGKVGHDKQEYIKM